MKRIGLSKGTRLTLTALAVFAAAAIYVASLTPANAVVIAGPNVCAYYSDATYTTVVCARGTGCCGAVISWGVTTPYKKCQKIYCTQQVCPN